MFRIGSAARGLIARGEVDPFAGLGYAVWPPKGVDRGGDGGDRNGRP